MIVISKMQETPSSKADKVPNSNTEPNNNKIKIKVDLLTIIFFKHRMAREFEILNRLSLARVKIKIGLFANRKIIQMKSRVYKLQLNWIKKCFNRKTLTLKE